MKNIKELREAKNFTQKDVAKKLGVSRQAIAMWEAAKRELRASTIKKLSKILGVTTDEIIKSQQIKRNKEGWTMQVKRKQKKVNFGLKAPEAKKVVLTGDFNSWKEKGLLMKKDKKGFWKKDIGLKPGRYEYKFLVDGQWTTDPANTSSVSNAYGATNSVMEVNA